MSSDISQARENSQVFEAAISTRKRGRPAKIDHKRGGGMKKGGFSTSWVYARCSEAEMLAKEAHEKIKEQMKRIPL